MRRAGSRRIIMNQHGVTVKQRDLDSESNFNSFGRNTVKEDSTRAEMARRRRPQPRLFKPASNEVLKQVDLIVEGDKAQITRQPRNTPMLIAKHDHSVKHSLHLRGSSSVKTTLLPE